METLRIVCINELLAGVSTVEQNVHEFASERLEILYEFDRQINLALEFDPEIAHAGSRKYGRKSQAADLSPDTTWEVTMICA